jgi:hypothetical protein
MLKEGSKDAKASWPIARADGPRAAKKSDKMPEWGLKLNLIDGR